MRSVLHLSYTTRFRRLRRSFNTCAYSLFSYIVQVRLTFAASTSKHQTQLRNKKRFLKKINDLSKLSKILYFIVFIMNVYAVVLKIIVGPDKNIHDVITIRYWHVTNVITVRQYLHGIVLRRRSNGEGMIFVGYARAECRRVVPAHIYQVRRSTKRLLLLLLLSLRWESVCGRKSADQSNRQDSAQTTNRRRIIYRSIVYNIYYPRCNTSVGTSSTQISRLSAVYRYYIHFYYDNIIIIL